MDNPPEGVIPDNDLYAYTINFWYFSEIGFDNDEVFIKRFNDIFYENKDRYGKILQDIEDNGYSWDRLTRTIQRNENGTNTDTETGTRTTSNKRGGSDTYQKGVKTTSQQSTSNNGSKLARSSPNENLNVSGNSSTTIQDSGSDINIYDSSNTITETPNVTKGKTYNADFNDNVTETREKLSIDELTVLMKMKSVYREFAYLFENLFMEVL